MEINYDYRVKLRVLNILKDSFGAFVKNENKANIKKIPCVNIETAEEYEVNMGQLMTYTESRRWDRRISPLSHFFCRFLEGFVVLRNFVIFS